MELPTTNLMIENDEQTSVTITDPKTGVTKRIPLQQAAIMVNPQTGERVFTNNASLHITRDGRIARPEEGLYCRDCGSGPWTNHAVAYCIDCQVIIGRHCCTKDQASPRCKRCRRKRFLQWLLGITPSGNAPAPREKTVAPTTRAPAPRQKPSTPAQGNIPANSEPTAPPIAPRDKNDDE
jgi:hypothetical protein